MTRDLLAARHHFEKAMTAKSASPMESYQVIRTLGMILDYLEGMEAVTNRPTTPVAQEGRAYEPNPKTPPTQETTTDVPAPTCDVYGDYLHRYQLPKDIRKTTWIYPPETLQMVCRCGMTREFELSPVWSKAEG